MLKARSSWKVEGEVFPRPVFHGDRMLVQARDRTSRDLFEGMQALHVLDRRASGVSWSRVMPAAHDCRVFPTGSSLVLLVDGSIEALSWSDGAMLWDFRPPVDTSFFTPAVTEDLVVAGRSDNVLSLLDARIGHEVWSFASPLHVGAPAVELPWMVCGSARFIYGVRRGDDGVAWRYDPDGSILSTRLVDGRVWLVERPRRRGGGGQGLRRPLVIACLDVETGDVIWASEPVPIEGGRLHVEGELALLVGQGELVAFRRDSGATAWRRELPVASESEVEVLSGGRLLVGPCCIDPAEGELLWRSPMVGLVEPQHVGGSLLFVRGDRLLRVRTESGESMGLHALPPEGSPLFHVRDETAYWGDSTGIHGAPMTEEDFAPAGGDPLLTCSRCRGRGRIQLQRAGRVSAVHDCEHCGSSGLERCNLPVLVGDGSLR